MFQKFLDRNLDLAVAFVVIALVGLAYGSFAHERLRAASQAAEVALVDEESLGSSFCLSGAGAPEHIDLKKVVSFQQDPTILSSLTGNTASVQLRQQRPHRAEYHPRPGGFTPRIVLVKLTLDEDTWCVTGITESE